MESNKKRTKKDKQKQKEAALLALLEEEIKKNETLEKFKEIKKAKIQQVEQVYKEKIASLESLTLEGLRDLFLAELERKEKNTEIKKANKDLKTQKEQTLAEINKIMMKHEETSEENNALLATIKRKNEIIIELEAQKEHNKAEVEEKCKKYKEELTQKVNKEMEEVRVCEADNERCSYNQGERGNREDFQV